LLGHYYVLGTGGMAMGKNENRLVTMRDTGDGLHVHPMEAGNKSKTPGVGHRLQPVLTEFHGEGTSVFAISSD